MIGRLMGLAFSLVGYLCVATCIAGGIIVGYVVVAWQIDQTKIIRILAAAHGINTEAEQAGANQGKDVPDEQVSLKEIAMLRAVKVRQLELREEAVRSALDQLQYEQKQLSEKIAAYDKQKGAFEAQLAVIKEEAESEGTAELTAILEKIKAGQAKQQIVQMLNDKQLDEVVTVLSNMQDSKRAKIIGEFKTPEESLQLAEVLRRIRDGAAEGELADEMQTQTPPTEPKGP